MKSKVLICDLDNTLYDWVSYFVPSFYAMVDSAIEILECNQNDLLDELKLVHKIYNDSEHPFALLETDIVKNKFSGKNKDEIIKALNPAFHAFNSTRKKTLKTYPDIHSTLSFLKENNVTIIAHTESRMYGVVDRLRRLELTPFFTKIYCRQKYESNLPTNSNSQFFDNFPLEKIVELSHHQRKPDISVLLEICRDFDISPSEAAFVGDSMTKDILMAKKAGLKSIWAKYGTIHPNGFYNKLVRVSHWSEADIEFERKLKDDAMGITPDYIATNGFSQILEFL